MPFTNQTYDSYLLSSFLLYLNNKILSRGGFTNYTGNLYRYSNTIFNYYTYKIPFNQINSDSSISGAIPVPTGVTINNSFITTGISGFVGIDYENASVYFNTPVTGTISLAYSLKDYNIKILNQSEVNLLFESKFNLRPKTTTQSIPTGIESDALTYPCILIDPVSISENKPFSFGGLDLSYHNIGLYCIHDSAYNMVTVNGLIRDLTRTYVPLYTSAQEFPYNNLGGLKDPNWSYTGQTYGWIGSGRGAFIEDVQISLYNRQIFQNPIKINSDAFLSVIDVKVCTARYPRY